MLYILARIKGSGSGSNLCRVGAFLLFLYIFIITLTFMNTVSCEFSQVCFAFAAPFIFFLFLFLSRHSALNYRSVAREEYQKG